jgi:hypothetical protein
MEDDSEAVVLADSYSRVLLRPAGAAGLGWPMSIEALSGPFSVRIESEASNLPAFRQSLQELYHTLTGSDRLTFWSAEHEVTLHGDGRGGVSVSARITDDRTPWSARLSIKMNLDQSYLPEFIRLIGMVFHLDP